MRSALPPRLARCATLLAVSVATCIAGPLAGAEPEWLSLFDGQTLSGWKAADFGGAPEDARVENGTLILDMGTTSMSGVTCTRQMPTLDYEVSLQAQRVQGSDFFATVTFAIKDSFCSLVVGGWGGSLVGISSFEGMDASENETT